ncbi:serine/threonine-protein kinase [Nonomuraea sp. NPDC047897]|uniref:serine/threonine-protein kinase n=1 Tax=Nonomuraea sp. NPDC047897 TaxID=3364346 RepID=UPI00371FD465
MPIASGGMGTVWRGYDRKLKRAVALKELRFPEGLSESERDRQRARVMTEARVAARLDHPGIVSVYDVIEDDGRPWIVMRLVAGRSLAEEVEASGALSPRRAAEVGLQLLDALTAAHAEGVLHRDVKPQNVLLDSDGNAVLGDFGIALLAGATRPMTESGLVVGTLGYVAPERLAGAAPGPASDLWSLGATLYFAVEGRQAYDTGDVVTTIAAIVSREPEPMRRAGPLVPVIAGLMARDADARLDASAAREHLRSALSGRSGFVDVTKRLSHPDAPNGPVLDALRGQDVPPVTPGPERSSDRLLVRRGRVWAGAGVAAVTLVAGGMAAGMLLAGEGGAAGPGGAPKTPSATASATAQETGRFVTVPEVCRSGLFSAARVEELVSNPRPGVMINTGQVSRCEWRSDRKYMVQSELRVNVMIHGSAGSAAALLKESAGAADGQGAATTSRPRLGDEAELVIDDSDDRGEARIRISNLTIEVRYSGDFFDPEEFTALVREITATAEAGSG